MRKREYSEAKQKELATRAELGPRLPRSRPVTGRVYTDTQVVRGMSPRRNRLPGDTGG